MPARSLWVCWQPHRDTPTWVKLWDGMTTWRTVCGDKKKPDDYSSSFISLIALSTRVSEIFFFFSRYCK